LKRVVVGADPLETLLILQAKKRTGDYRTNMNADNFCRLLELMLLPVLDFNKIEAILVMDNASYHCTPVPGSVIVNSFTTKKRVTDVLDVYNVPYRAGKGPHGDSLIQLKQILREWLAEHGAANGVIVNRTRVDLILHQHGHPKCLMTPPYHPELQPIEELWRDVKMYVARLYGRTRTMRILTAQVREGFTKYSTKEATVGKMRRMEEKVQLYTTQGCYNVPAPDFDAIGLTGDDNDDFQDADLAEGDVEEEIWNADADGDINAEMEEDEFEED